MAIRFAWSKGKAALNLKRHLISFEEARNVFDDPYFLTVDDCETDEGMRYHAIGYANERLYSEDLLLFYIISARKAEQKEEHLYAQQFS